MGEISLNNLSHRHLFFIPGPSLPLRDVVEKREAIMIWNFITLYYVDCLEK
jgi:hypothetical protein